MFQVLSKIPFRFRVFLIHLSASACLLATVFAIFYFGWYDWPGWYLVGVEAIVGLMVFVDIGLGPIAGFVVSNPSKPRRAWRRDMAFILIVQFLGLGLGIHALWLGRPLYYVLSMDRIEIVTANSFRAETVDAANRLGARIVPHWSSLPTWVWAPLPDDAEERRELIQSAISGGDDVVTMPAYFRPWADAQEELKKLLTPLDDLSRSKSWSAEYADRVARLGGGADAYGMLPVQGPRRSGTWVFQRRDGQAVTFWPIEIWGLRRSTEPSAG